MHAESLAKPSSIRVHQQSCCGLEKRPGRAQAPEETGQDLGLLQAPRSQQGRSQSPSRARAPCRFLLKHGDRPQARPLTSRAWPPSLQSNCPSGTDPWGAEQQRPCRHECGWLTTSPPSRSPAQPPRPRGSRSGLLLGVLSALAALCRPCSTMTGTKPGYSAHVSPALKGVQPWKLPKFPRAATAERSRRCNL